MGWRLLRTSNEQDGKPTPEFGTPDGQVTDSTDLVREPGAKNRVSDAEAAFNAEVEERARAIGRMTVDELLDEAVGEMATADHEDTSFNEAGVRYERAAAYNTRAAALLLQQAARQQTPPAQ
jgi:hypothetical protein